MRGIMIVRFYYFSQEKTPPFDMHLWLHNDGGAKAGLERAF